MDKSWKHLADFLQFLAEVAGVVDARAAAEESYLVGEVERRFEVLIWVVYNWQSCVGLMGHMGAASSMDQ